VRTASQQLILFALVISVLASQIVGAQSAPALYISGTIVSGDTRLPGVLVAVDSSVDARTISTFSDEQGHYRLTVPAPGTYRIRVELFGFSPNRRVLPVTDQETQVNFTLALAKFDTSPHNHAYDGPESTAGTPTVGSHEREEVKSPLPLSAEIPMDFSFVTGQLAEAVATAGSGGGDIPIRQSALHFNASYEAGNSALDARPYALHGIAAAQPEYAQNTFGGGLGGILPWHNKAKTSLFASYSGSRSGNPFSGFATVPTAALRTGDFSDTPFAFGSPAGRVPVIYDPVTGQPFAGNRIPVVRMSPTALALLRYFPIPNRDGSSQNFRFVTAAHSRSDGFMLSLTHMPLVGQSVPKTTLRSSFNASLGYQRSEADLPNIFPLLGGRTTTHAWNGHLGHALTKAFFTNELCLTFGATTFRTSNQFRDDIAARLGITGVSQDGFDWGLPAIDLTQFTGLRDVAPMLRADRSFSVADAMSWSRGKHNLKWGGEFRRLAFDLHSNTDGAGSFLFTGFATAQLVDGVPVRGTGSDFADFLLGLPQKTHVQYANGTFSFGGQAWSLYLVDDWRVGKYVSLNLGLRYEFVSPLSEARRRLVTLDAPSDFSAVAVVPAGAVGPFNGRYPDTIVAPDRNNFAPRVGIAWRAAEGLIVRSGYSINYDPSPYYSLATRLALQPPFAVEQTGIAGHSQAISLENGFPGLKTATIANSFATSSKLPLGYAQVWVLELQKQLPGGVALATSYTGSKGSHLQMFRAPNRTATGLLLPNVAPFLWQADEGSSILHAGSVRLQKSFAGGLSFGVSYMFSRSIDNDPGLGDDTPVAQDDRNLARDRGVSAFDQRHRLRIDYQYELPFGRGARWLNKPGIQNQLFGAWSIVGTASFSSGLPLSPHVVGAFSDAEAGGYGALRPDVTGQAVQLSHPTTERFFNTSAFIAPTAGLYGNAGRNIIIGPKISTLDITVMKLFTIGERHSLQFHAQVSNLLNTPQFMQVDTNLNSFSYGQITNVGRMRAVQLGLQYAF
jgi:hypothetical protein